MSFSRLFSHLAKLFVPLVAVGTLLILTSTRLHRVDDVTHLVETEVVVDPASASGYAGGLRNLIVPGHNNESYQWILQTQQMLAGEVCRVRHVTYDNAPIGRRVLSPSPYRWWLGLLAQADHAFSDRPAALSVERVARLADPILHLVFLVVVAALVGWQFGVGAASVVSVAIITLFPLAGTFLPGQPGDGSLVLSCISFSILLLLAGIRSAGEMAESSVADSGRSETCGARWFFVAGIIGGLGLWVDAVRSFPVVVGIALGGVVAIGCARRAPNRSAKPMILPWRHWALGGALTTLAGYLLEYSPAHLGSLHLTEVHPLYGIGWIGLGEGLARLDSWLRHGARWADRRTLIVLAIAVLAVTAVPVSLVLTGNGSLLTADPSTTRLTNFAGGAIAPGSWAWIQREGISLTVIAACLPALLLVAAIGLVVGRGTNGASRILLAVALGPTLVVFAVSCFALRSWNEFDATVLGLLAALATITQRTARTRIVRGLCLVGCLSVLVPGAVVVTREARADRYDPATGVEITGLIERDLAHWLSRQAGPGGAVVFAPPNLTTSLIYHGGLSGIGTPFWENTEGFAASMRIAGASTPDEAHSLVQSRNVDYIVIPSWDNFLEEYARQGATDAEHTLIALLRRWLPPRWLRPVPYHLPNVSGFESQSVAIFRVVEVQDNATALSYLAEYFMEMGMIREAVAVAHTLERTFPADLGAAVARALVSRAAEDTPAFERASSDLQAALARGDGEFAAWDRRVNLAIALVDGRRVDQAREEVQRCLAEIDEARLRSLTTLSLRRLLVLIRTFGLKIDDPQLDLLSRQLLPAELRDRP